MLAWGRVRVNERRASCLQVQGGFDFLARFHRPKTPHGRELCYCLPSRRSMRRETKSESHRAANACPTERENSAAHSGFAGWVPLPLLAQRSSILRSTTLESI